MTRLAALFPGQGSQSLGMAKAFYDASPAAKRTLDEAEAALPGLLELMWEGPAETLRLTENQQPALVAAGAAAFAAWREAGGAAPAFAAGHSLGEYTALVAAGVLALSDALPLVRARGRYMQAAVPEGEGAMAAVLKVEREVVERALEDTDGVVEIANLNSPGQIVISGAAGAVAAASDALKAARARVVPLKVSAPFHCSLMRPAADALARDLAAVPLSEPRFPVVVNVTAEVLPTAEQARALLAEQVTAAVRWTECVERLDALGAERYVEFGAGKVLTGLVGRILESPDALPVFDPVSLEEALA